MNVMIIGGTSGIGFALARHYLDSGADVAICGRDLRRVDADVATQYQRLSQYELDIADRSALDNAINAFAPDRLDLLIVAAGFYFNNRNHPLDEATTLRMIQTNVTGLNNAFELAAKKMLAQQSGQLVAISSIAGLLRDYPGASLYSATKRSVLSLCETYRSALSKFSISVTAIVPGYVDTAKLRELNDGDASHKRFIVSEQEAVRQIVYAIDNRLASHVFPKSLHLIVRILNRLPKLIRQHIT